MTDETGTEWVTVKHVRFPIPGDEVVARYPTYEDALLGLNALLANRQWFTEYSIEKHNRGG